MADVLPRGQQPLHGPQGLHPQGPRGGRSGTAPQAAPQAPARPGHADAQLEAGLDYLVAPYEDEWTCGKAQDHRHSLLHYGQTVLDCAYLSDEMLEARNDAMQQQCMNALAGQFQRFILRMNIDPYH